MCDDEGRCERHDEVRRHLRDVLDLLSLRAALQDDEAVAEWLKD